MLMVKPLNPLCHLENGRDDSMTSEPPRQSSSSRHSSSKLSRSCNASATSEASQESPSRCGQWWKKYAKILIKPPTYESQEGLNKFNMC